MRLKNAIVEKSFILKKWLSAWDHKQGKSIIHQLRHIIDIQLFIFEWASGLKINRSKSELFYLDSNTNRGERLAEILECKVGTLPICYLGLPLLRDRIRKDDGWNVISKLDSRIEGWQTKLLSLGGRLTLVNSVLSDLPLFYFSVFKAPKCVLRHIDSLRRAFFWKGGARILEG